MSRILILAFIAVLAYLIFKHGAGNTMGLAEDDMIRLISLSAVGLFLAGGLLSSQRSYSTAARNLGIWLVIILGLITAWLYRDDAQSYGGRLAAALAPGRAISVETAEGYTEVTLYKSGNGHYEADALINGVTVPMLVDTGATGIALTYQDAVRLGLKPESLTFNRSVMTANGIARISYVRLDDVSIGAIHRSNIEAGIAQPGALEKSLLGMNFLETLTSVTMTREQLLLKD